MQTQTQQKQEIVKVPGGYVVHGRFFVGTGVLYRPLSGSGPHGFSPDFGITDLWTLPAAPAPEPVQSQLLEEEHRIHYMGLPKWYRSDGCTNCQTGSFQEVCEMTDSGERLLRKCRHCGALHRQPY